MKILHTADWHLGKKLEHYERTDEHRDFLAWLIEKLDTEHIDVLIVAGDIFDTGTPSNAALEQYYGFLRQVKDTCCREVIIIGGNHDSISTLHAPKELLKYFHVHIIGGVPEVFTDQIIPICNAQGQPELVVCAVPFLRDRDIRLSIAGESSEEREARIKQGIVDHYLHFREYLQAYKAAGIPIIATGHLFAAGSSTSDSEKEIHVGNLGQVAGDQFPEEFSYVALGHIHRPQVVNSMEHIRYSGSPIALSFSEHADQKQVLVLEFEGQQLTRLEAIQVPCYRQLLRIKGTLPDIKKQIAALSDPQRKYPSWVEVQVITDTFIHDLEDQLNAAKGSKNFIERFFPRQIRDRASQTLDEQAGETTALSDLEPRDVFLKRCEATFGDADYQDLVQTFDEVMEHMTQQED